MIGDDDRDIVAGINAGCTSIKVNVNKEGDFLSIIKETLRKHSYNYM